jgi:predicted transcriptional regulator
METYLMSVKPTWASLFFSDDRPKTVELRKGNFGSSLSAGDRLLIYATLPVGEVIGEVRVRDRSQIWIDRLRRETEQYAQVSAEDFDAYYQGKDAGVAVWVDRPKRFESAIDLVALKDAGINPPQQLLKLSSEQIFALLPVTKNLANRKK